MRNETYMFSGTPTTTIITSGSGTTIPGSTICATNCQVDVFATELVFTRPVSVVDVTIATAAVDVHITVFSNGTTATDTSTRQLTVLPEQTATSSLIWEFSGVALTWPTTYLAYTAFSHEFVHSQSVTSDCSLTSSTLVLGSPTNFASLIFPADATPGPNLPPSALIDNLNAQPVVLAQLGGTPIGSSCDPVAGGVSNPTAVTGAQVVFTSVHVLAQTPGTTDTVSVQVQSAIAQQATAVAVTTVPGGTTTSTSTSTGPSSTAATVVGAAPPSSPTSGKISTVASTTSSSKLPQQVSTAGGERAAEVNFVGMEGWLAGVLGVGAGLGML